MSYTQMNSKFSTVENTVVTKGDILVQGGLPQMSNKYQILRGYVAFGSAGRAAGSYSVIDELTGQPMNLRAGTYIDKVIAYSGSSASSATALAGGTTLTLGLATSTPASPTVHFMFGSVITVGALSTNTAVVDVNKGDPSTGIITSNAVPLANLQAGMSCHPDVVVGAETYINTATTGSFTGLLNVLVFVASP